jgi:spermidine/putrescine transport system ATP-binding protein
MSDRIAVMDEGVVQQIGPPEEIYETPQKTFVAGFIGVSNLMPAVVEDGGRVRLENGPVVHVPSPNGFRPGQRCYAVVRPEKLRVSAPDAGNGAAPSVEGTVESSLYLGTSTQLVVDLGDGVKMTVLVPNADEAERQALPGGGARVRLSWEPEHMHLVRESSNEPEEESVE